MNCVLKSLQIYIHGDYSSLHKHIPAAILPEEYGDQPPMDNRPYFQSLLDSEEYFGDLIRFNLQRLDF